MQNQDSNFSDVLIFVGSAVVTVLVAAAGAWHRRHPKVDLANTPILLAYYTDNMHILVAQRGTIGGMNYQAFATIPQGDTALSTANTGALLYRVELPFITSLHVLGIPKHSKTAQIDPEGRGSIMERVDLEGNYSNSFGLYCEAGMQVQSRYVLDPSAMMFTLDFCQSHCWEITAGELYFVQEFGAGNSDDSTFMYNDIEKFVASIKPAHVVPAQHSSYGVATKRRTDPTNLYRLVDTDAAQRRKLKDTCACPVCDKMLMPNEEYYSCPDGDGVLIEGFKLPDIKSGDIPLVELSSVPRSHGTLQCPACKHVMEAVPYAGSKTIIDSCTYCPYRWLDAGELVAKAPVTN